MTDTDNLLEKFNNYLSSLLEYDDSPQHKVIDSMKYSLFSGGKRIRSMLTLLTYSCLLYTSPRPRDTERSRNPS